MEKKRLPVTTFGLPVQEVRRGYHAAVYFVRSKAICEKRGIRGTVTMQVFQKNHAVLCNIDEVLAILRVGTGHYKDRTVAHKLFDAYIAQKRITRALQSGLAYTHAVEGYLEAVKALAELELQLSDQWVDTFGDLQISALHDGDRITPWESVMHIRGPWAEFAQLESYYLGVMARGTLVATNTRRVVDAAEGLPILFFADRFDRYSNHAADGYAAMKAGAFGVASDQMGEWWGVAGSGTNPHGLIAVFNGNTVDATLAFAEDYPDLKCIALVDFSNDCVEESLKVSRAFRDRGLPLWAVRPDTSENMVDVSLWREMGGFRPNGVCAELVRKMRHAMDVEGFSEVGIFPSGGFNAQKIIEFRKAGIPVCGFGVGESLLRGGNAFTADIVQPIGKVGRPYRENPRLTPVTDLQMN